jgi:predicted MFS family arabinose efflux permease
VEQDGAPPEPGSQPGSRSTTGPDTSIGPASHRPDGLAVPRWAWGVLLLLFAMHLLDSVDRWLLAGILPDVRHDLELSETQAGWLSTILLLGLAAACPPLGYLVDRLRRPRILAVGFAVWSLATVSTGLARSYGPIQLARALVGVGSAAFVVSALTILMDLFPRRIRARALAVFFLAVPCGVALALSLGVALAHVTSWQTAFLVVGAPGLLLALLALAVPDPTRGSTEEVDIERLRLHERVGPSREDYIDLMVNSSYTYSVFGITFSSFALAGLVFWSKTFLSVGKGLAEAQLDSSLGLTFLAAAILGTAAGGWLADRSSKLGPRSLFLVPGLAMLAAIPCVLTAIYARSLPWILGGLFLAEGAMFLNVVPCFTILSVVVMPNMRAVACAVALAAVHLLGDFWSPLLMDWVIDTFGQADSMATGFGNALAALGAVPVAQPGRDPENLTAGMLVVIPALLISGIVLLSGARHLPREMALMLAKLRAAPSRRITPDAHTRPRP